MARQTATVAVIEADPERNGDELLLRQAEAELYMAMADYEGNRTRNRLAGGTTGGDGERIGVGTVQALERPLSLEDALEQLWRAEQEQEQRCLLPTPDPVQSMILQKEIDLAQMAWLELVFPPTIPVSPGQDMVSRAQIQLELEQAASHYESGRAQAKAKFDQAAAQATATVQALQPTPLR